MTGLFAGVTVVRGGDREIAAVAALLRNDVEEIAALLRSSQ